MLKSKMIILALAGCALFWQCGQDTSSGESADVESSTSDESEGDAMSDPQKAMEEAMNQIQNLQDEAVEVVDFRELKKLLPETLAGMERASISGEKAGAMGITVSQAEASYKDGDQELDVQIVDAGGTGMMAMGMAAWASAEIDREDENGWAKTTTIGGHKAYQEHDNATNSGEFNILIAGRGIVNIEYSGMETKQMKKAVTELDLNGLAGLFNK